jgi:predicted metal-binding membrane protein
MTNTRRPERAVIVTAALAFAASTTVTVAWCSSMSAMPGMDMPGGWTMSMTWMRMPGQSWTGAAATFLGMWIVMMVAMMLPVLAPMLLRYQRAVSPAGAARLVRLTIAVGAAYFLVWAAFGLAVYPVGIALAEATMTRPSLARATPVVIGLVVMIAGLLQYTAWKARQLVCCHANPVQGLRQDSSTAFRHGMQLGMRCIRCCLGPTVVLLCLGVMDLRAMAIVTAAIALERLSPAGLRLARLTGALATSAGLWMTIQAAL